MPPDYHAPLLVGYFDYAILAVLVLANAWYAQRLGSAAPMRWAKWVAVLLFGIVLPLLSIRSGNGPHATATRRPNGQLRALVYLGSISRVLGPARHPSGRLPSV